MDATSSSKKVLLVGHCGPDASYLRIAIRSALGEATILPVDDQTEMNRIIQDGVDLVLLNRELDYGFDPTTGVEMIQALKPKFPKLKMMLISNYPEAQSAALAAGALPGFGKREIGSPRAKELLRGAVNLTD
jgi:two-component system chemotaxis response regulator CheY